MKFEIILLLILQGNTVMQTASASISVSQSLGLCHASASVTLCQATAGYMRDAFAVLALKRPARYIADALKVRCCVL